MNARERVFTALNHEEPDRVPRFNWFAPGVSRELRRILGVPDTHPRELDVELGHDWMVDFLGVISPWVTQLTDPSLVPEHAAVFHDAWGIQYRGLHEEDGGSYPAIIKNPLSGAKDLSGYTFPSLEKDVDLAPFFPVLLEALVSFIRVDLLHGLPEAFEVALVSLLVIDGKYVQTFLGGKSDAAP